MIDKKIIWGIGIACILLLIAIIIAIFFFRSSEDTWIKDSNGIWIKHGNPSDTPEEVVSQQDAIVCGLEMYNRTDKENISSQCLGSCWDYAIDLVHVPRDEVDNRMENQCEDYRVRKVRHFIELDKEGNIVRII